VLRNVLRIDAEMTSLESKTSWETITSKIMRADALPQDMVLSLLIKHPLASSKGSSKSQQSKEEQTSDLFLKIPNGIARCDTLWVKQEYKNTSAKNNNDEDSKMNESKEEDKQSVNILLVQRPSALSDGFGAGWDILCPMNVSVHLWDKLAKQS
jgi:hypothetical protein